MRIISVSLMTLWMACALLGFTLAGSIHLLAVGSIAIELMRHTPRPTPTTALLVRPGSARGRGPMLRGVTPRPASAASS